MIPSSPKVTVGLPVYNGERYLEQAVRSVLQQDFVDFELLIADNASTDATPDICRSVAALDDRIRYVRHAENLGAMPNFTFCANSAQGRFFSWLACDDFLNDRSYLSTTVAFLEAHPDVVCCGTGIRRIEEDDTCCEVRFSRSLLPDVAWPLARRRFFAYEWSHDIYAIFGMFRREALQGIEFYESDHHPIFRIYPERLFLAQVALRGRIVMIETATRSMRFRDSSTCQKEIKSLTPEERGRVWVGLPIRWRLLTLALGARISAACRSQLICVALKNFLLSPHELKEFLPVRARFIGRTMRKLLTRRTSA